MSPGVQADQFQVPREERDWKAIYEMISLDPSKPIPVIIQTKSPSPTRTSTRSKTPSPTKSNAINQGQTKTVSLQTVDFDLGDPTGWKSRLEAAQRAIPKGFLSCVKVRNASEGDDSNQSSSIVSSLIVPAKRGRGRPRKSHTIDDTKNQLESSSISLDHLGTMWPAHNEHIRFNERDYAACIEYDMDEQDIRWLLALNNELLLNGQEPISEDLFEGTIEGLELGWHQLSRALGRFQMRLAQREEHMSTATPLDTSISAHHPPVHQEQPCEICAECDTQNSNVIVLCDGCDLAVHQECYGVPHVPEGPWLCRRCLLGAGTSLSGTSSAIASTTGSTDSIGFKTTPVTVRKNAKNQQASAVAFLISSPSSGSDTFCSSDDEELFATSHAPPPSVNLCTLCPWPDGALKRTTDHRWVHCVCVHWLPPAEAHLLNVIYKEPVDLSSLDRARLRLKCSLCKQIWGAPCQCSYPGCTVSFHVLCARAAALPLDYKNRIILCWKHREAKVVVSDENGNFSAPSFVLPNLSPTKGSNMPSNSPPLVQIVDTCPLHIVKRQSTRFKQPRPVAPAILIEQLVNSEPWSLNYDDNNNRRALISRIARYWSLKRESRRGDPLLRSLQIGTNRLSIPPPPPIHQLDSFANADLLSRESLTKDLLDQRAFKLFLLNDLRLVLNIVNLVKELEVLCLERLELMLEALTPIQVLLVQKRQQQQRSSSDGSVKLQIILKELFSFPSHFNKPII